MHYLDLELKGIDEKSNIKDFKLKDFQGKNIILYFYPQDDTPTCTKEAQYFRDEIEKLKNFATIIGVSESDIDEHIAFQKKHKLNFILLSDNKNELKKLFEQHLKMFPKINRSTFILDKNGAIIKLWEKVDVDEHMQELENFFNKS